MLLNKIEKEAMGFNEMSEKEKMVAMYKQACKKAFCYGELAAENGLMENEFVHWHELSLKAEAVAAAYEEVLTVVYGVLDSERAKYYREALKEWEER